MTTALTATDMLAIHTLEQSSQDIKTTWDMLHNPVDLQTTLSSKSTVARLNYLGSSYGTFLGNTFASLYPQYVGRMVLDGNIDADNWVSKWWTTSILDFEAIWKVFYDKCYSAQSRCALWRSSDSGVHCIEQRVQKVLDSIEMLPWPLGTDNLPDVLTISDVREFVFHIFYSTSLFPNLANVLNQLLTHNFSQGIPVLDRSISCVRNETLFSDNMDAFVGTFCGDADPSLANTTISEFQRYVVHLESQSRTAGAHFASNRPACMTSRQGSASKTRFSGPFGSRPGDLQTPILFLNNRLDPVCPIRNARRMATKYPGSIVLEQDAVGHCALAASLGPCVKSYVRRYFNEGVLPPNNTVCPGGCEAFDEYCAQSGMYDVYI